MPKPKSHSTGDAALGMNSRITRRDFVGSTLLASGALLLRAVHACRDPRLQRRIHWLRRVGEYAKSNGNTLDVVQAGHTIRDGVYDSRPKDVVDTGRRMTA